MSKTEPGPWIDSTEAAERLAATRRSADYIREVLRVYGGAHALSGYEADAQALADVRTLDAWQDANPKYGAPVTCPNPADGGFATFLGPNEFQGDTRDEARAKAAAWVREQAPRLGTIVKPVIMKSYNPHDDEP